MVDLEFQFDPKLREGAEPAENVLTSPLLEHQGVDVFASIDVNDVEKSDHVESIKPE